MINLARTNLRGIPHVHPHHAPDSNLAAFADDSFDLVYSYAVFQHIPDRKVVFGYLNEAKRVLKDRLGRAVENVASIKPPQHGKDLRTSIDLRLQFLAYRELKAAVQSHRAISGALVMLDAVRSVRPSAVSGPCARS